MPYAIGGIALIVLVIMHKSASAAAAASAPTSSTPITGSGLATTDAGTADLQTILQDLQNISSANAPNSQTNLNSSTPSGIPSYSPGFNPYTPTNTIQPVLAPGFNAYNPQPPTQPVYAPAETVTPQGVTSK
ncbi:MAG: hypothetical protein KGJ01_02465 [Patescibacteria group bacterium]|nr:hypothetical protein [Patescibacteria group bacterium]